jgi:hypothetical protein
MFPAPHNGRNHRFTNRLRERHDAVADTHKIDIAQPSPATGFHAANVVFYGADHERVDAVA